MLQEAKSHQNLSVIETEFVEASETALQTAKLQEEKLWSQLQSLTKDLEVTKARERAWQGETEFVGSCIESARESSTGKAEFIGVYFRGARENSTGESRFAGSFVKSPRRGATRTGEVHLNQPQLRLCFTNVSIRNSSF